MKIHDQPRGVPPRKLIKIELKRPVELKDVQRGPCRERLGGLLEDDREDWDRGSSCVVRWETTDDEEGEDRERDLEMVTISDAERRDNDDQRGSSIISGMLQVSSARDVPVLIVRVAFDNSDMEFFHRMFPSVVAIVPAARQMAMSLITVMFVMLMRSRTTAENITTESMNSKTSKSVWICLTFWKLKVKNMWSKIQKCCQNSCSARNSLSTNMLGHLKLCCCPEPLVVF